MHKFSTRFICIITISTLIIVGGATALYWLFAPNLFLNQQKSAIVEAGETLYRLKGFNKKNIKKYIQPFEDDGLRFIFFTADGERIYSTDRNGAARMNIRFSINHLYQFEGKGKAEVSYNETTRNPNMIFYRSNFKLNGEKYYVYIYERLGIVEQSFDYSNAYLLYIVAASLVINAIVVLFLSRHISKPITKLDNVVNNFINDDLTIRYDGIIPNDEIGNLINNFNKMADRIQENISSLNNYNFLLREDLKMMSEYDEMRKKVVRNITHDLKTPLAIISSQIEMMQVIDDDKKRRKYYNSAMDEIEKMSKQISEILTESKNKDEREKSNVKLNELIENLCKEFKIYSKAKDVKYHYSIEKIGEIYADEQHIRHIFNNYVLNAISHIDDGEIKISLKKKNGRAILSVYNDGENIPKEDLQLIWNNFQRGNSKNQDISRTGIGLYIVKEISIIDGDECGVENTDTGVTFWYSWKI